MAQIALVTAGKVNVIESIVQATLPAAEAIAAGDAVRLDTSSGKFTKANASGAAEARIYGIALRTVAAGEPLTALRKGVIDGFNITQDYDAAVYLIDDDGQIGDANGTVNVAIGRVMAAPGQTIGTALDKVLFLDL